MEKITDKPRTISELAHFYSVSRNTMKKWLTCKTLMPILKQRDGNYFSIAQLKVIIGHIGEP